jgi:hypothetical protein
MCYFNTLMGQACPSVPSQIALLAPANDAADNTATNDTISALLASMMSDPASAIAMPSNNATSEFVQTYVVQDTSFFDALISGGSVAPIPHDQQTTTLTALGLAPSEYAKAASKCIYHTSRGVIRMFIQCVIRETRAALTPSVGGANRRRLLSTSNSSANGTATVNEQNGGTLLATMQIYHAPTPSPPSPPPPPANVSSVSDGVSGRDIIIISIAGTAGVLMLVGGAFMCNFRTSNH